MRGEDGPGKQWTQEEKEDFIRTHPEIFDSLGNEPHFYTTYDTKAEALASFFQLAMPEAPSLSSIKQLFGFAKNAIPEGKLANHIFSGKAGKLLDTTGNRAIITKLSNNSNNLLGTSKYGVSWYAQTLNNGSQIYSYTQNGIIKGAGINQVPVNLIKLKGL